MKNPINIGRRKSFGLLGGLSAVAMFPNCTTTAAIIPTPKHVNKELAYDLNNPKDRLLIFEKIRGDLSGKQTFYFSEGRVFGIRPDLPDNLNDFGKEVFRFSGGSIRIKKLNKEGNVETKSRNWLLYQDPKTGAFLDKMKNPYTGEEVVVPPFRGGISGGTMTPEGPVVNANFKMESTAFGQPLNLVFTKMGNRMHITRHAFTKWFEKKSQTWRTEMTLDTYDFDLEYLYDRDHMHIPADTHWTSQTSWLSLLKMSDKPGHMLWSTNGRCFYKKEDLPATFIAATEEKQPDIFSTQLSWEG